MNRISFIKTMQPPLVQSQTKSVQKSLKKRKELSFSSVHKNTKPKLLQHALISPETTSILAKHHNVFVVSALAVFLALGVYVYGVNEYAAKGYEIKGVQQRIKKLEQENKQLLVEHSENAAVTALQNGTNLLGLVPVTTQEYLNTPQISQR